MTAPPPTGAPLDEARLRAALLRPEGPYAGLTVLSSTGSTNADLVAASRAGAADRTVLIAEEQTTGRGRRSREWASPSGAGLYLSVLLRPDGVGVHRVGWIPLLTGLALVRTAASVGVPATLKWPNDLLVGDAKCAGILAEMVSSEPPAVVVGIGVNVSPLPAAAATPGVGGPAATSLRDAGAPSTDRTDVAVTLLTALAEVDRRWRAAAGDVAAAGLLAEYRERCGTLGRRVRVELAGDTSVTGTAEDVDAAGQLVLRTGEGTSRTISAGDVVHLRANG